MTSDRLRITGALVAVASVAVGAGSILSAQVVSFYGMDPAHALRVPNVRERYPEEPADRNYYDVWENAQQVIERRRAILRNALKPADVEEIKTQSAATPPSNNNATSSYEEYYRLHTPMHQRSPTGHGAATKPFMRAMSNARARKLCERDLAVSEQSEPDRFLVSERFESCVASYEKYGLRIEPSQMRRSPIP